MGYDITLFIGQVYPEQTTHDKRIWFNLLGSVQLKYAHTPNTAEELTARVEGAVSVFMYSPVVCNVDHQDETCKEDRYGVGLTAVPINHVIEHFEKQLRQELSTFSASLAADEKIAKADISEQVSWITENHGWVSAEHTEKLHWLLKNFRSYYSGRKLHVVPYGS